MHDLSLRLEPGMVTWPGDPPFLSQAVSHTAQGDSATVHQVSFSTHTGTHIDAPRHFFDRGQSVDQMALSRVIGVVEVVDLTTVAVIDRSILAQQFPRTVPSRILFRTQNSVLGLLDKPQFVTSYTALDYSAAAWLVERGVQLVGIDYFSIDRYEVRGFPVHRALLSQQIAILEALRLVDVSPGRYHMLAIPLPFKGMDGSPVRVLLYTDSEWSTLSST